MQAQPATAQDTNTVANANLETLTDVVTLLEANGAMILAGQVGQFVQLIRMKVGHIEFVPVEGAPQDLSSLLGKKLTELTKKRWVVTVGRGEAQKTLKQVEKERQDAERAAIVAHSDVQNVIQIFPNAEITMAKSITDAE